MYPSRTCQQQGRIAADTMVADAHADEADVLIGSQRPL